MGGPSGPLATPPDGRGGGGRHGSPGPGGQPSAGGSRPSPAPLYLGLRYCLQVGDCARVPLWGVSFAVSESQRPDDLVCFVQRRRPGACLAWDRGFRHCCVAVPKSRGWGADVPWLVRWCVGALLVVGVADGHPRGGRFPALRGASGVRRCPSPSRPSSGALAPLRCSLWGWREGLSGGGAFNHCGGRLRPGAVPPPTARPLGGLLGSATHVLWARVCGCVGPTLSPRPACPAGAACRGGGGGPSPGGWPATVARGAWCQALSLPRPPVLWSGQLGFRGPCVPGPVGVGVGTQHLPHSVRPCGPALLAVGVAEGRPRGGCLPPL